MNLLWVATKAPWPPVDGGRLLLHNTFAALAAAGHRLTLVAPVAAAEKAAVEAGLAPLARSRLVAMPSARPRPLPAAWLRARRYGWPLALARHHRTAVRRAVAAACAEERFDAVIAEQVHALAQLSGRHTAIGVGAGGAGATPPVVLRAQNVESDLWAAVADSPSLRPAWPRRSLLRAEARRLARFEGAAVRRLALTVALTAHDAARLAALAGAGHEAKVRVIAAPFAPSLPAADRPLAGAPAVVVLGSGGWLPNRDGVRWLLERVWPGVRRRCPEARLHLFGLDAGRAARQASIESHPAPEDSRDAFAPGALLAVPLLQASGVRMKILEAWARGLPVVATPVAARGLEAEDGRELLVAADPEAFAGAIARLHAGGGDTGGDRGDDGGPAAALVAAGRAALRRHHDFSATAAAWAEALATSPSMNTR